MSLRAGDRIGDYEVVGMLGAGGMGAVYQVRHLIADRIEAMKVLLPDLLSTPELAERFIREIRVQASLSHPNIAAVHNAFRAENQFLLVMEFVDGQTLADVARLGPLRPSQAIEVIAQVLAALDYAHARGIVHRDVKPSNMILTRSGLVKLMDFGIAREITDFGGLTQAGAAVGSLSYMSPEQVAHQTVDGRSDVYAAGLTLYELLTGERPIKGGSAPEVLEAQLRQVPVNPRLLNPGIPEELARNVLKALEKNPMYRYQTAGDFRADLLRVQATMSEPGSATAALTAAVFPGRERTPAPSTASGRAISHTMNFDPLSLDRLRQDLARHIGPMAKVLVDRAAKRSRTWQELYAALAPELPAGKERERFLAACPRV